MAGESRRWIRPEPKALLLFVALSGFLFFSKLVEDVLEHETGAFDRSVLLMLRSTAQTAVPIGPAWLEQAMVSITALGSTTVITMVTVLSAGYLVLSRRVLLGGILASSIALGAITEYGMKSAFARVRPEVVPHLVQVTSLSFPSGHAMLSAITYLSIGALVARAHADRRSRIFVICAGVAITLLIGFSRVYLGVHWPTDVLAGWIIGSLWALGFWVLSDWLKRKYTSG